MLTAFCLSPSEHLSEPLTWEGKLQHEAQAPQGRGNHARGASLQQRSQQGQQGLQLSQVLGSFRLASCSSWAPGLAQGPLLQRSQQQLQREVGDEPVPLPCTASQQGSAQLSSCVVGCQASRT